jgi:DNA-binding LacI/PurR family transcriptional regulator
MSTFKPREKKRVSSTLHPKADFKYSAWAQQFREQIAAGVLESGARLPSFNDLSELHNLSQATAERIYKTLEEEGLVVREPRRGVFVAAQSQREHPTDTICVVCPGFGKYDEHPYYAQLIGAAHRQASADEMRILLCDGETIPDTQRLGGILQITPHGSVIEKYRALLPVQVPLVSVLGKTKGVPAVIADETDGIHEAFVHLLKQGHHNIGMLATHSNASATRVNAYQNAMNGAGLKQRAGWLRIMAGQEPYVPFEELGYRSMKEWLADDWEQLDITALLCQNDDTAGGVLRAASEAGIRVPEELSLVGFDGTKIADFTNPRLTTTEMPFEAMIARAWQMLCERRHPLPSEWPTAETVMLPTTLRIAQSTAAPKSL